jgi:predicted metal-dependent hydrolase
VTKYFLEGIGEINIKRNSGSRLIRLRIDPEVGIILIIPEHTLEKEALKFAASKSAWIKKSMARRNAIKNSLTIFKETTQFRTRQHCLYFEKHAKSTIKSMVWQDKIMVWFPEFANIEDQRVQKIIRRAIEQAWRIEALRYLPVRTQQLASKFKFNYNRISIKNAKTRWGSCSAENNINLNLQLMRLPDHLIDYVILHELVHTVEKNHQKSFWKKLEQVLEGAIAFDKELNKYDLRYW